MRDELNMAFPLGAAVAASGVLLALATHSMDLVALLVFAAPLLVTQVAFRNYAGIRATYLQTVRALSRVTEVGGYVEPGHSRRVSRLAVAVGRELGMAEPELLDLEYAALMHDIGQLSLRDPIPGGATVLADPEQARRIAELGAEVIRQTGVLDRVAEIVRRQCDHAAPTTPPLASRIIKAANAYDDLVGGSTDRDRAGAALERLRLGAGTATIPSPRGPGPGVARPLRRTGARGGAAASCRAVDSLASIATGRDRFRHQLTRREFAVAEVRAEMVANVWKVVVRRVTPSPRATPWSSSSR